MLQITQTIETALYTYDPTEFMPIYEDGELANRAAFVAYKLGRANQHLFAGARHMVGGMIDFAVAVTEP